MRCKYNLHSVAGYGQMLEQAGFVNVDLKIAFSRYTSWALLLPVKICIIDGFFAKYIAQYKYDLHSMAGYDPMLEQTGLANVVTKSRTWQVKFLGLCPFSF